MKKSYLVPLAALLAFGCGLAHAESSPGQETGRLKVCRSVAGGDAPLEIPYGAKFVFGGKDGIAKVVVAQTNFVDTASPRAPSGYDFKTVDQGGVAVAQVNLAGKHCVYLDAVAPPLPDKGTGFPASFVHPDWPGAEAQQGDKFVYTYFPSADPTFYIASEVGKNMQFVVHEMTTGAYTNHDKFNNVAMDNPSIIAAVANGLRKALGEAQKYDAQLVTGSEVFGVRLNDTDLKEGDAVAKAVAQFRKNVVPLPKSRIIVAVPHRSPVKVPFRNTVSYGGKVEGLGFYVDVAAGTDGDDGTGVGVMDVFLNCRYAVIDIDSAKVLAIYDYAGGKVFPAARAANGSPFSALNDQEMFMALNYIAAEGANDTVPKILSAH